ncbi:MAG: carboxynorspermidine decarboxylase [Oscillospiraceae bacterium]|nr:carboxynorspermidine decarboxylase [Oscillospiraceae bacterium]
MMTPDGRAPFAGLQGRDPEELFGSLPTPCYILDEGMLRRNGEILAGVGKRTGCGMLLAQKAFSNYDLYPVLEPFLTGTEASGLYEARLGYECLPGKQVHVYSAAYRDADWDGILRYADHIIFNSPAQLARFGPSAAEAGKSLGLRINPRCSTQPEHPIYDPCAPGSRLGTTREAWDREMTAELIRLLDGLHFHTLCEQDADALDLTLKAVERDFGDVLENMKWLNMGGGHHITRPGYDLDRLEQCLRRSAGRWDLKIFLEPGEAWALNAGYLASRVLDVTVSDGITTAVLDTSAACHMPDVLEMPYRPPVWGAVEPGDAPFSCRLAGPTCLAGDIIGEYGFSEPLKAGDLVLFGDMAIYTTCKNNTFNGLPLPAIFRWDGSGAPEILRSFGYEDFKTRLGRP